MDNNCPTCDKSLSNVYSHLNNFPSHRPDEWPECHDCGIRYKRLGSHWCSSDCDYEPISNENLNILKGILMGDGYVASGKGKDSNSYMVIKMTNKKYLEYIFEKLGNISASLYLDKTAKENAKEKRNSGFRVNAKAKNYQDLYHLQTRSHPVFNELRDWYSSGSKKFPENLKLTSKMLKHWFVCDGSFDGYRVSIALSNESGNERKINNYLNNIGLDKPKWSYRKNSEGDEIVTIDYTSDNVEDFFNFIGEPVPGFEYKWPDRNT